LEAKRTKTKDVESMREDLTRFEQFLTMESVRGMETPRAEQLKQNRNHIRLMKRLWELKVADKDKLLAKLLQHKIYFQRYYDWTNQRQAIFAEFESYRFYVKERQLSKVNESLLMATSMIRATTAPPVLTNPPSPSSIPTLTASTAGASTGAGVGVGAGVGAGAGAGSGTSSQKKLLLDQKDQDRLAILFENYIQSQLDLKILQNWITQDGFVDEIKHGDKLPEFLRAVPE